MIVTSDKYEGDKESARGDLLDVLEHEEKVEELLNWLEGFLPGRLSKLRNETTQAPAKPVPGKKPETKPVPGKKPETKAAPKKPTPKKDAPKDKTASANANQKKPAPAVKKDATPTAAQPKQNPKQPVKSNNNQVPAQTKPVSAESKPLAQQPKPQAPADQKPAPQATSNNEQPKPKKPTQAAPAQVHSSQQNQQLVPAQPAQPKETQPQKPAPVVFAPDQVKPTVTSTANIKSIQKKPQLKKPDGQSELLGKRDAPNHDNQQNVDPNSCGNSNEGTGGRTSILDRIKPIKKPGDKRDDPKPRKLIKSDKLPGHLNPYGPMNHTVQPINKQPDSNKQNFSMGHKKFPGQPANPNEQNNQDTNDEMKLDGELERAMDQEQEFTLDEKFVGKIRKRCAYWPQCTNEECSYIHPTENCPKFPKCNYGESCFYLHPSIPCRFGLYCQRPGCSYVHPEGYQGGYNPGMYGGYQQYGGQGGYPPQQYQGGGHPQYNY